MEERGKPLPIETLPRKELEKLQNKRLRYTLRKAYETTLFWHKKFDSLGIKPEDIKNKEDLERNYKNGLKLSREELVNRYEDLLPTYVKNKEISTIEVRTSGFTGVPKRVMYSLPPSLSTDTVILAYNAGELFEGDRILLALAPYPYSSGIFVTYGLENYIYKIEFEPKWSIEMRKPLFTDEIINKIKTFNPSYFTSSPTTAIEVVEEMIKRGIEPANFNVRRILVGGEASEKERKEKIGKKWDAEVFDAWATTEAAMLGYECKIHEGMHIAESRILFSVVNSETREVLGEKEEGTPLLTLLYDEKEKPGMYIINYDGLGDVIKILDKEERCECGRRFTRVEYPKRSDETLNVRGVKFYARAPERVTGINDYITVEVYNKRRGMTRLEVRYVPEKGYKIDEIEKEIFNALLSSNPDAEKLLKDGDICFIRATPATLYIGLPPQSPGKRKRLYRVTEE